MWWLHIQSVINMDYINGCINAISRIFRVYLICLTMDSPVSWCCRLAGLVCTEYECVSSCVTCFVMLAREYGGLGSLVFCSSIRYIVVVLASKMTPKSLLTFLYCMLLIIARYVPDSHICVCYWECVMRVLR